MLQLQELNNPVDFYFAQRLAPNGSKPLLCFLADLLRAAREGHLCVPTPSDLMLPDHLFEEALVREKGRIYLRRNWECEKQFIKHFHRLKHQVPAIQIPPIKSKKSLQLEQQQAINNSCRLSLSLICGGPGTGKTFTAIKLIEHFLPFLGSGKIALAAPTGKAAANLRRALLHIEQAILVEVQTLHSLLKKKYLAADVVLVDEASMIDAKLMASLVTAIKKGARLILIGDKDQLPPVESGNVFADIAEDAQISTLLNCCLRTDISEIVEMANAVKRGENISTQSLPDSEQIIEAVLEGQACVLTPLRYGPFGVDRLNQIILKAHLARGGKRLPIMITVNDPVLDLYNGDTGELVPEEKSAYFGARKIPEYALPRYEYAYVLSVHKSQGSEYDHVMILLPQGSEVFGREMLYTAITRAKKRIDIYAYPGVLSEIISKQERRLSGIRECQEDE